MLQDVNLLEQIFFSTDLWGIFGPLIFVGIGYYVFSKNTKAGYLYMVVIFYASMTYFNAAFTSDIGFVWHGIITLMGALFLCVYPLWEGK